MMHENSFLKKMKDVIRITISLYLAVVIFCITIAAFIYFEEISRPNVTPLFGFYVLFVLGMPLFVCGVAWFFAIKDTRFRRDDPYRFSKAQYRFLMAPNVESCGLREKLETLGYQVIIDDCTSDRIEVVALRARPKNLKNFHEKRAPIPHRISINGSWRNKCWYIQVGGTAISKYVLGDFRNTVYDSIEELIDELNWRPFLKNESYFNSHSKSELHLV